jgi:hypothetical protein
MGGERQRTRAPRGKRNFRLKLLQAAGKGETRPALVAKMQRTRCQVDGVPAGCRLWVGSAVRGESKTLCGTYQ